MLKILHHLRKLQVRSKIKVSKYFITAVLLISVLVPLSYIYAALSCSVTTQAACAGTTILRMSGSTNAHAELPGQTNANYASNVVCCSNSPSAISNSCSGNFQSVVRISGVTNGTTQESTVNTYGTNVCLSDATGNDTIIIGYQNTNCSGFDTTLLSLSSSDNAHVGDGSAYTRKVCGTIIPQTITFDLDVATTNINTNAPYSVPLGTLTTAQATNSDNSTIKSIWVDLDTNAAGGAVVTVVSANGSLQSTSVPTSTIPSSTGTMAPGVARYGLCVGSVTQTSGGTLTKASPFNGVTCTAGSTNNVGIITTSPQNILTVSSGIVGGRSEIRVNAENSNVTPSHNDYTDTLTFIATGTF